MAKPHNRFHVLWQLGGTRTPPWELTSQGEQHFCSFSAEHPAWPPGWGRQMLRCLLDPLQFTPPLQAGHPHLRALHPDPHILPVPRVEAAPEYTVTHCPWALFRKKVRKTPPQDPLFEVSLGCQHRQLRSRDFSAVLFFVLYSFGKQIAWTTGCRWFFTSRS